MKRCLRADVEGRGRLWTEWFGSLIHNPLKGGKGLNSALHCKFCYCSSKTSFERGRKSPFPVVEYLC